LSNISNRITHLMQVSGVIRITVRQTIQARYLLIHFMRNPLLLFRRHGDPSPLKFGTLLAKTMSNVNTINHFITDRTILFRYSP